MKVSFNKPYNFIKNHAHNYTYRINYTYQHKKAFLKVEKEVLGKNTFAGYMHDTNKIIMYSLGLPKNWVRTIHRALSPHHPKHHKVKNIKGMIIDWMCASFTKPDKQLSARDYYEKLEPEYPIKGVDEMLTKFENIMKNLNKKSINK